MRRKSNLYFENKKLTFLLVFLTLIIISLIIVVIAMNRQKQETTSSNDVLPLDCTNFEESYDFASCIETNFNNSNNLDELISSYREVIDISKAKQRYYTAANLITARTNFLISLNQCDQAMELLDAEIFDSYDPNAEGYAYSRAINSSMECKDEAAQAKWNELLTKNNQEVQNAIGT